DIAAEKVVGGEMPSHKGRVRNSRILASAHVTSRARHRAGTVRTYAKYADFVSRDDAAPTRTELDHVDRRHAQWESGARAVTVGSGNLDLVDQRELVVLNETALGRRSAHVEGKDVGKVQLA